MCLTCRRGRGAEHARSTAAGIKTASDAATPAHPHLTTWRDTHAHTLTPRRTRPIGGLALPLSDPNQPPFDRPLGKLAEGERRELPLGSLGGFVQGGLSVARGADHRSA